MNEKGCCSPKSVISVIHVLYISVDLNINTTGLNVRDSAMNWIVCVCFAFGFFFRLFIYFLLYCENQLWKIHNSEIVCLYLFEIKRKKEQKKENQQKRR